MTAGPGTDAAPVTTLATATASPTVDPTATALGTEPDA